LQEAQRLAEIEAGTLLYSSGSAQCCLCSPLPSDPALFVCIFPLVEAQKEQKRKEYVQKQKQKLAQYQNKVKSEAEKIQVMLQLQRTRILTFLRSRLIFGFVLLRDVFTGVKEPGD
jgi:hypothetical protein